MFDARLDNKQYCDPKRAVEYLGQMLHQGSLALVIGAGASAGIGLPNWLNLVKSCLRSAGLPDDVDDNTPNAVLMKKIDSVERTAGNNDEYFRIVHDALYSDGAKINFGIFNHPLLVAIGALIMGGRRGTVREVLNFNFDNILEYYLGLYGTESDVVYKLPSLRKDKDVTIYHPHGYLPKDDLDSFSDFLILSRFSYDKRLGASLDVWKELSIDFFRRKVALFIGLSGEDAELMAVLSSLESEIRKERPTGFWLFGNKMDEDEFLMRNVVPVRLETHSEYPEFILKICQEAAKISML